MEEALKDAQRYGNLLYDFEGVPYSWGMSSYMSSDCSGSISCVLNLMYNTSMRWCADDLYKRYFTLRKKEEVEDADAVAAVFFLDKNSGRAVHVAGRLKRDWFMNVSSVEENREGHARHISELKGMYPAFDMVLCALDKEKWIGDGRKSGRQD